MEAAIYVIGLTFTRNIVYSKEMKKLFSIPASFYAYSLVGILCTMLITFSIASAEEKQCYGQYGQQIPCPVENKAYTLEKLVEVDGTWVNNRPGVAPDSTVRFLIQVENTGEVEASLTVEDTLPANLSYISVKTQDGVDVGATLNGSVVSWTVETLQVDESRSYIMTTEASGTGISAGEEKCGIENVAQLTREGEVEAKDSAYVCIKKGDVLGDSVDKLPETGLFDGAAWIIYAVIFQLAGLLILGSTRFLQNKRY